MEDEVLNDAPEADVSGDLAAVETTQAPELFFDPTPFYEKVGTHYKDSGILDPIFKQYEDKYKDAVGKYAPYEPFVDRDPQELSAAVQLFDMIDTQEGAQKIYEAIGQQLGLTAKQVEKVVESAQDDNTPDDDSGEPESEVEKELRELKEWRNQQDQRMAEQVQIEQQRIANVRSESEIDEGWKKVLELDPTMAGDKTRTEDLMERVYNLSIATNGERPLTELSVIALNQQRQYNQHLYDTMIAQSRNSPGNSAPTIMSPTGSNPGSGVDPSTRGEAERKAAMVARLRELNASASA